MPLVLILAIGSGGARAFSTEGRSNATLDEAQQAFYVADYVAAAAIAETLATLEPDNLAAYEVRTSALHFQIKRLLGDAKDREKALKACASCAALISAIAADTQRGQQLARARLKRNSRDQDALFFLGKINLTYVWLQLSTLGRRTGWSEYREARRSIDQVLAMSPTHVRARVAQAWIEYIVDTRVPMGLQWVVGGGNKRRALQMLRAAASADDPDRYVRAEANFALWEMLAREGSFGEAVVVARHLTREFPENRELARFVERHGGESSPSLGSTP